MMRKIVLFGLLILLFLQPPAFTQQKPDGAGLLKRLQEMNEYIRDIQIEFGETLIRHLQQHGNDVQAESMKSIYRIVSEYQNFLDCEERVLFMYSHVNEKVKVYISAYLRDSLQKKKIKLDDSLQNFRKYHARLQNKDSAHPATRMQSRLEEAQDVIDQIINFYSTENEKYRRK